MSEPALTLRDLRLNRTMTQTQLGAELRVSGRMIACWETGKSPVPAERIEQLAAALSAPIAQVEAAIGALKLRDPLIETQRRRAVRDMIIKRLQLEPAELDHVIDILERIATLDIDIFDHSTYRAASRANVVCDHAGYIARNLRRQAPDQTSDENQERLR